MHQIDRTKTEYLTKASWGDLYEKAQGKVPYYLLAKVVLRNGFRVNWYDGVTFSQMIMLDRKIKDPSTQAVIERIYYYVMKCFEVVSDENGYKKQPLPFEASYRELTIVEDNMRSIVLATGSVNFFLAEQDAEGQSVVNKCQMVIAMNFMSNPMEKVRWLLCARDSSKYAHEALVQMQLTRNSHDYDPYR